MITRFIQCWTAVLLEECSRKGNHDDILVIRTLQQFKIREQMTCMPKNKRERRMTAHAYARDVNCGLWLCN